MKTPILIILIIYYADVITAAKNNCPDRQSPNPFAVLVFDATRKSENVCTKLGVSFKSGTANKEEKKTWDNCKNKIVQYFKDVEEDDKSIEQFVVGACINVLDLDPIPCIDVILHLENLCYNMTSAYILLASLGKEKYRKIGGYSSIKVKAADWSRFGSIGYSLRLHNCLTEFSDEYGNKVEVLETYSKWWDDHKYSSKHDCTCTEVFGFSRICNSRKKAHGDIMLKDYFETICLAENNKKNRWNEHHYRSIAESKYDINPNILKEFLIKGISLVESGWGKMPESFTKWSFDDVYEAIDIKSNPNEISDELVKLISHAIYSGFSSNDYKTFLMTTTKEGYGSVECRLSIFNEMFDKAQSTHESSSDDARNKYFWFKTDKSIFNEQLNILLQIHKSTNNNSESSCFSFVNILKRFKQIIYKTTWTSKDVTDVLNIVKREKRDVGNFLNCLSYCEDIENRISFLNMLQPKEKLHTPTEWQATDDYGPQFAKFRKIFFEKPEKDVNEICSYDHVKYNTGSRPNIVLLMNHIIFNDENKYKSLQELMDSNW